MAHPIEIMREESEPAANTRLLAIANEIDRFEGYSEPHCTRIAEIAEAIGRKFNLASHDRFIMRQAALAHDIGELAMNRDYIGVNRGLTSAEMLDMHRHPVIGEQQAAKKGLSRGAQLLIRWHHESWNGGGYPDSLEETQIPLAARILSVADAFVSLTSKRPHRNAHSESEAKRVLTELAGIKFDPAVVKAFLEITETGMTATEGISATGSE